MFLYTLNFILKLNKNRKTIQNKENIYEMAIFHFSHFHFIHFKIVFATGNATNCDRNAATSTISTPLSGFCSRTNSIGLIVVLNIDSGSASSDFDAVPSRFASLLPMTCAKKKKKTINNNDGIN